MLSLAGFEPQVWGRNHSACSAPEQGGPGPAAHGDRYWMANWFGLCDCDWSGLCLFLGRQHMAKALTTCKESLRSQEGLESKPASKCGLSSPPSSHSGEPVHLRQQPVTDSSLFVSS